MEKSQLLQSVKQELESRKFDVKLNEDYHGIDVTVHALSKLNDKRLFIYVVEDGRALPVHCINLNRLRDGNNRMSRPNCDYMVYAPNGAVDNALLECEETDIPIYTNKENFVDALKKYSSI